MRGIYLYFNTVVRGVLSAESSDSSILPSSTYTMSYIQLLVIAEMHLPCAGYAPHFRQSESDIPLLLDRLKRVSRIEIAKSAPRGDARYIPVVSCLISIESRY